MISIFKPRQKFFVVSGMVVWIVVFNLWIYNYYANSDTQTFRTISSNDDSFYPIPESTTHNKVKSIDKASSNRKDTGKVVPDNDDDSYMKSLSDHISFQLYVKMTGVTDIRNIQPINSHIYNTVFDNHDVNSVLSHLDFNQRCKLYFETLYSTNHNWRLDPNENFPSDSIREFPYRDWRQAKFDEIRDEYIKNHEIEDFDEDHKFENHIRTLYKEFWKKTQTTEQNMMNYLSHLRIFNKCFIENDGFSPSIRSTISNFINDQTKFIKDFYSSQKDHVIPKFIPTPREKNLANLNLFENCGNLEERSYPWLSFNYPVFERWDGQILIQPPKFDSTFSSSSLFSFISTSKKYNCFFNDYKRKSNGRGIVLSINDGHVDDTIHLIHTLRALNNKLPIQIVYYDSLSPESKQKVVNAAREDFFTLPDSFQAVKHHFPKDYLIDGLPKQEVWFVNVYGVINDQYRGKFHMFGNKFLATIFNSFQEFMLTDADTVLLENPEYFFNLKGYKDTGAYFFRDRSAPEFRPDSDGYFVKKITPSIIDHAVFDIKMITHKTTNFDFFDGMNHCLESGVVVMDRARHYSSLLLLPQLHFMDPVRNRSWGDKELFWMAFAINGDENFTFNDLHAAAVGVISPPRKKEDGTFEKSLELCSAHPGHVNGEDKKTLLWINSGFKLCGQADQIDYKDEFDKNERRYAAFKNPDELRQYYSNPMEITHAIIPPFKSRAEFRSPNEDNEPPSPWDKVNLCKGYVWCAHSSIGGRTAQGFDNIKVGTTIEFSEDEQNMFKFYGDIWVGVE